MMALIATDLPVPVAPATSKCGVLARSNIKTSFVIVLPYAIGSFIFVSSWKRLDAMTECIDTTCGFSFGTSIPTVPLPGIGAMIRIPVAERDNMISFSNC